MWVAIFVSLSFQVSLASAIFLHPLHLFLFYRTIRAHQAQTQSAYCIPFKAERNTPRLLRKANGQELCNELISLCFVYEGVFLHLCLLL